MPTTDTTQAIRVMRSIRIKGGRLLMAATTLYILWGTITASAQIRTGDQSLMYSQQFRQAEAFIRVAEPDQLADTVYVWGDVSIPGAYIVPRGSSVLAVLTYARGPLRTIQHESTFDWYKPSVQVRVSSTEGLQGTYAAPLGNMDVVALEQHILSVGMNVIQVRIVTPPAWTDKLRIVVPVVGVLASIVAALAL